MTTPLRQLPDTIASRADGTPLDSIGKAAGRLADRIGPGPVKDLLSGTWLGHPLHPMLTDLPIGAWTSSFILDAVGGERGADASRTLVGVGVLAAVPTAVSGWSDWADTDGEDRTVGLSHAVGNVVATALYGASWLARRGGRRGLGIALAVAGSGVATGTAYLGGHLVYGRGIGVDNTAFDRIPKGWTAAMSADDLPGEGSVEVRVRGVPVMIVRQSGRLFAMHDRCTHRGGPLHRGDLGDDTITCPWHGSCFQLKGGDIVRGPATAPQPSYEVRIHGESVEIRRRTARS
jgi:nitrite reductase/ring-hydroxylating ferredoxin subunit/uncharacterized membrane protein